MGRLQGAKQNREIETAKTQMENLSPKKESCGVLRGSELENCKLFVELRWARGNENQRKWEDCVNYRTLVQAGSNSVPSAPAGCLLWSM